MECNENMQYSYKRVNSSLQPLGITQLFYNYQPQTQASLVTLATSSITVYSKYSLQLYLPVNRGRCSLQRPQNLVHVQLPVVCIAQLQITSAAAQHVQNSAEQVCQYTANKMQ